MYGYSNSGMRNVFLVSVDSVLVFLLLNFVKLSDFVHAPFNVVCQ